MRICDPLQVLRERYECKQLFLSSLRGRDLPVFLALFKLFTLYYEQVSPRFNVRLEMFM